MFQLTECEIEVPIVELQPEKQEQERQKIAAPEGIVYPIRNDYTQTFYVHPHNTSIYNNNITNGYKAKYVLPHWVDFTHETDGDIRISNFASERPSLNFASERPSLPELTVWSDDQLIKHYEPRKERT